MGRPERASRTPVNIANRRYCDNGEWLRPLSYPLGTAMPLEDGPSTGRYFFTEAGELSDSHGPGLVDFQESEGRQPPGPWRICLRCTNEIPVVKRNRRELAGLAPVLNCPMLARLIPLFAVFVPRGSALHVAEYCPRLVNGAFAAAAVVAFCFPIRIGTDFSYGFACHTTFSFQRDSIPLFFFCLAPGATRPVTCAEVQGHVMAINRLLVGARKPTQPKEPEIEKKSWPKDEDYGFKVDKAMTAAKLSVKMCAALTGLSETTIKTARTGDHILVRCHKLIVDVLERRLSAEMKELARIPYPWTRRTRTSDESAAVIRVPLKFPDKLMQSKAHMPQAADSWELDLQGGKLEKLTCTVETSTPYFRFGIKLFPKKGILCGDTTIQTKEDFLIHIARNHWDQAGVAKKNDLFITHYVGGVGTPKNEKICTVRPLVKAKLELAIDAGFKLTFDINGRRNREMPIEPALCNRLALFAWDDHYGDLKVKVRDLTAIVLKTAE